VQGDGVAPRIASAIRFAAAHGQCDVLVLARGGGSLEDLWAFNEEVVARAIFESKLPIVTGIGHEVDFTIADFVADVRAPTPSGAVELIAPDCNEWLRSFDQAARRMRGALRRLVARRSERAAWLARRLAQLHPGIELRQRAQRLDELEQRLTRGLRHFLLRQRSKVAHEIARLRHASPRLRLANTNARLQQVGESQLLGLMRKRIDALRSQLGIASGRLNTVSPLATLQRGYAIVTNAAGTVVTDASALKDGDRIEAKLAKGSVHARVEGTSKE
jgi:exodeoxyribonuclease VII large subunit